MKHPGHCVFSVHGPKAFQKKIAQIYTLGANDFTQVGTLVAGRNKPGANRAAHILGYRVNGDIYFFFYSLRKLAGISDQVAIPSARIASTLDTPFGFFNSLLPGIDIALGRNNRSRVLHKFGLWDQFGAFNRYRLIHGARL